MERFNEAISLISPEIKSLLMNMSDTDKKSTYEIRLRSGKPIVLFVKGRSLFINNDSTLSKTIVSNTVIASAEQVTDSFNRLCSYSIHTHQRSITKGYITMKGGHRAGIVGTAICNERGEVTSVRDISSINIRVARQIIGCARELYDDLASSDFPGLLIAGAPGSGKTTMLRDLIRVLSTPNEKGCLKVCLIDEREELAAVKGGICMNDIGVNCDVLDGYPKSTAITLAVKTMSPDIIACDELATEEEIKAVQMGTNCGVKFIATVHASSLDELASRKQIDKLLDTDSFEKIVLLSSKGQPCKIERIFEVGEIKDEIYRRRVGLVGTGCVGSL